MNWKLAKLNFFSKGWNKKHFLESFFAVLTFSICGVNGAAEPGSSEFRKEIEPILQEYCYDCHSDGMNKGGVEFDKFESDRAILESHDLWLNALKNVRAGMMPPAKKAQPTDEEKKRIEAWIKKSVFQIDPQNPDPGKVTVRRLNRVEYRNTIRDLVGVDFKTDKEFPPDDTGHGFDNIGDVLTISPMLLEKYLDAAKAIVTEAVPMVSRVPAEHIIQGRVFRSDSEAGTGKNSQNEQQGSLLLSYYKATSVSADFRADHAGQYQLVLDLAASERYVDNQFDYNKCRLVFKVNEKELLRREFTREGSKPFRFEFDQNWPAGTNKLTFEIEPLTPDEKQIRSLAIRVNSVTVRGPMDVKHWVPPRNYDRFFTRKEVPATTKERRKYAAELLGPFAEKAFRRLVDKKTVDRLVDLAESIYSQPKQTFEAGVAQGMTAILASPRFLFREEGIEPNRSKEAYPFIDEYALASRLSYFLWSSMPDEELFRLASQKQLRKDLHAQIKRMLADPKSKALTENFSGQWLQVRDIETVQINARSVLARDDGTRNTGRGQGGFRRPRAELTPDLRRAMRQETEWYFDHIVRQDRSVLELIHSDYTFLNEELAKHYGLTNANVSGPELRRVVLPAESPRGGILTHGSILAVTSNPTRTSPVKRGLFVLENILGTPPPPAPPDIPSLEESEKEFKDREPTLRETLEMHRSQPLCSSCHNRMDPLGLALENFNAMGMWRDKELNQPVDVTGKLITGESFTSIQELKRILAAQHRTDFYRTLTEKLLTYALGRGLEYYDVETVDRIVKSLDQADGRFSALLTGIVESAPFQKSRSPDATERSEIGKSSAKRVELRK